MDFDNEDEQLEAIKEWLKKNGMAIVLGIVVVVAGTFGWRGWQSHQYQQAAQASAVYQQMVHALQQGMMAPNEQEPAKIVQQAADQLVTNWPKSSYAAYAHFALAKQAVTRGDYTVAIDELKQVVDKPAEKALGYTAQLRLARVYLAAEELDAAAALLSKKVPAAWQGQQWELKGDLAVLQDDNAAAQQAFEQAQQLSTDTDTESRIGMKLNQLKADL